MTRDEVFVPKSASERNFKPTGRRIKHNNIDLEELVDDAPLYRLWSLILQQVLGWPLYLTINVAGQPRYPKWTNRACLPRIPFIKDLTCACDRL